MSEARSTAITGAESRKSPILFVTRNFPPVRGGLERYSWDLYRSLSANQPIDLCANRRGRAYLVPFLARAVFYLIVHGRRYTHIHFGDGMLAPLALFARSLGRAQTSITIHGLDITYPNALFQFLIPTCVRRIDQVVCVSHATLQECVARGISADRCTVIPNGIIFDDLSSPQGSFGGLEQKYGFERMQRRVLLSVSRLVQRKGHAWFVSQVMPRLDASYLFLIAGEGPERPRIEAAIDRAGLADRVVLMGSVSDEEKVTLLSEADLFVMPNLHIQGDLEGFGISLLEAAAYGLPSIATYADGIVDAVIDGKTGLLVPEQDARAFAEAISSCVLDPAQVKAAVRESYSWSDLVKRYWDLFGGVV